MDPYLGAIIIGAEVTRLSANIDGVEVSLRCADLARTWQGVGTVIIGTDPPPLYPVSAARPCVHQLRPFLVQRVSSWR